MPNKFEHKLVAFVSARKERFTTWDYPVSAVTSPTPVKITVSMKAEDHRLWAQIPVALGASAYGVYGFISMDSEVFSVLLCSVVWLWLGVCIICLFILGRGCLLCPGQAVRTQETRTQSDTSPALLMIMTWHRRSKPRLKKGQDSECCCLELGVWLQGMRSVAKNIFPVVVVAQTWVV